VFRADGNNDDQMQTAPLCEGVKVREREKQKGGETNKQTDCFCKATTKLYFMSST